MLKSFCYHIHYVKTYVPAKKTTAHESAWVSCKNENQGGARCSEASALSGAKALNRHQKKIALFPRLFFYAPKFKATPSDAGYYPGDEKREGFFWTVFDRAVCREPPSWNKGCYCGGIQGVKAGGRAKSPQTEDFRDPGTPFSLSLSWF
jgi:hypothetical protein